MEKVFNLPAILDVQSSSVRKISREKVVLEKTKKAIEKLLACRYPKPDVRPSLRRLPQQKAAAVAENVNTGGASVPKPSATELFPGRAVPDAPVVTQAPALTVSPIKPLATDRYALKLTISERIAGKLKQAQALTPQAPAGDLLATVLEKALDLYIADRLKQTFAVGRKPRRASPQTAWLLLLRAIFPPRYGEPSTSEMAASVLLLAVLGNAALRWYISSSTTANPFPTAARTR